MACNCAGRTGAVCGLFDEAFGHDLLSEIPLGLWRCLFFWYTTQPSQLSEQHCWHGSCLPLTSLFSRIMVHLLRVSLVCGWRVQYAHRHDSVQATMQGCLSAILQPKVWIRLCVLSCTLSPAQQPHHSLIFFILHSSHVSLATKSRNTDEHLQDELFPERFGVIHGTQSL